MRILSSLFFSAAVASVWLGSTGIAHADPEPPFGAPEPGSIVLWLLAGFAGLLACRRGKRKD